MRTKTFIPIECDICYDDRISALINQKGAAGYGVYMILLLELRNRKGYRLDDQSLKMIARNYCIRRKLLDDVLYNYSLFTVEQLSNGDIVVESEYVTRVMRNYDDKIAECSAGGKKSADKRWGKKDNHLITTEQNITEQNTTEKKTTATVVKEKNAAAVVAVVVTTDYNAGKKSNSTQRHRNTEIYPAAIPQKRSLRVPHKDVIPVPLCLCVKKDTLQAFQQSFQYNSS